MKVARAGLATDAPAAMAQWFYGEDGRQVGPVEDAELQALIAAGQVGPATLLWHEGMPNWLTLGQLRADGAFDLAAASPLAGNGMLYPTTSGLAIASLVCGIVGIVGVVTCAGLFLGIPAVVCGHLAMKQIQKSPVPIAGRGMALAGLACGYLSLLILASWITIGVFALLHHR